VLKNSFGHFDKLHSDKVGAVQLRAKDLRKSWEEANEARMKNIARLSPENSQAFKSD